MIRLSACLAMLALPLAAGAQDVTLRFSTAAPPSDFLTAALESFAEKLAAADLGVAVEVFPASSLVRQGAEVPAIQRGNLEMSTMTTFEVAGQVPEMGFLNRAFLFDDYEAMEAAMQGPVGEALAEAVLEDMDIRILATAYLGTRQVNLRQAREVMGPDDLAGVKMRMPASPEWLLLGESLGVEPTPMAMPEVYIALQTGAVDGQENPLTILSAAKFDEVTEQVVLTSHLVQPVFFAIGEPIFAAMTPEQQEAVRAAAVEAAAENDEARLADEARVVAALEEKGLRVTPVDLTPFRERADEVYAASDLAVAWDAELMAQAMGAE